MTSKLLRALIYLCCTHVIFGVSIVLAETQVYDFHQLQLIREEGLGEVYYSTDSKETWTEANISPLTRDGMEDSVLEVGIYQTSTDQATAVVDDFLLWSELISTGSFE